MTGGGAVAWRLAWRSTRTGRWRSILVIVLIALATAVSTATGVLARSTLPEPGAERAARFGSAQMLLQTERWTASYDELPARLQTEVDHRYGGPLPALTEDEAWAAIRDTVPLHADVVRVQRRWIELEGRSVELLVAPVDAPVLTGLLRGDVDRTPGMDEVLVDPSVLHEVGLEVGDSLAVPGVGARRIVGQVERQTRWPSPTVVVAPGTELPAGATTTAWYVAGLTDAELERVRQQLDARLWGAPESSGPRESYASLEVASWYDGATQRGTWPLRLSALVAAVLLVQVGAVAAATFATGTRRRVREFGVLAAGAGADPVQIRRTVQREALVLGGAGTVGGLGLAIVASVALLPVVSRSVGAAHPGGVRLQLSVWDLLLPAALAMLAVLLAAWMPARTVSRVPLVTALAGRVPLRPVRRWVTPISLVAVVLGLGMTAVGFAAPSARSSGYVVAASAVVPYRGPATVAGIGLLLAGAAGLVGPLLQSLARHADRLPLEPRLAIRDSGRQRTRSVATVAATMVALVVPALVATAVATEDRAWARDVAPARDDVVVVTGPAYGEMTLSALADEVAAVRGVLPPVDGELAVPALASAEEGVDARVTVEAMAVRADGAVETHALAPVAVATPELLDLVGVEAPLPDDGVVLLEDHVAAGVDEARLAVLHGDEGASRTEALRILRPSRGLPAGFPQALVAPALAERVGAVDGPTMRVLKLTEPLSEAQMQATPDWAGAGVEFGTVWLPPPAHEQPNGTVAVWLTIAGALFVVLLLAVGTAALAATESDRDLAAMAAVGADPRSRPRFRAMQAWVHASIAAMLAIPIGVALAELIRRDAPMIGSLVIPWTELAVLLLLVPLLIAAPIRWLSRSSPLTSAARRPT